MGPIELPKKKCNPESGSKNQVGSTMVEMCLLITLIAVMVVPSVAHFGRKIGCSYAMDSFNLEYPTDWLYEPLDEWREKMSAVCSSSPAVYNYAIAYLTSYVFTSDSTPQQCSDFAPCNPSH